MSKKENAVWLTVRYSFLQSTYWMGFCAIFAFATIFLLDKGFTGKEVGIILAMANIGAAIIQPIVASFADQTQKITLKEMISIFALLVIILSILLINLPTIQWVVALLFISISTLMLTIQPLLNSLIFEYINQGISINYGLARGLGSLSFAAMSFILGFIVSKFSPAILPYLYILFYGLVGLIAYSFKTPTKMAGKQKIERAASKKGLKITELINFFKGYPQLLILLIGICCLFIFHNIINTYLIQIMHHVGGGDSDFGISLAVAASVELPMMMAFTFLVRKVKGSTLLKMAAFFFTIKAVVFLFAPSVGMIYFGQGLQFLSFALYIPASVYYINGIMRPEDKVKGQAIVIVAMTLGGVFGNLLGGVLLDSYGIFIMLLAGLISSLLGTILVFYSVKEI
ncbi:MFS transporter [Carnobacterium gallinarum]|uniref:MFS transporter n=1 Tax=Carnobacterium gallinarum TaxID=2749 RepID=UPI00054F5093|nr:MFS transporter [Carnobacterium gallinarum]